MERGERRTRRKSRKISETEQAAEEVSPPPAKRRKRSGQSKSATPQEEKHEKRDRRSEKAKPRAFRVSFDIVEHSLSVGEGAGSAGGCTLTLASAAERTAASGETGDRRGSGAGSGDVGGVVKRPAVDIKFKNSDFTFSYLSANKKRSWRSFKQIVSAERALAWKPNDPTFSSIDAPPPLKPAKKYADLSGFTAKYKDPLSGLMYSSSEEFRHIRSLPPNIVSGYLALHGRMPIM